MGDGSSLLVIVEVRQCREDESSDGANQINPIVNLHTRHLLPSRKKPTHQLSAAGNISQLHKIFKKKIDRSAILS